jgi:hypothetical protein
MEEPIPHGETGHGVRIVRKRLFLATLFAITLASQSDAGLFRRTPKPDAATYVPSLIDVLRTSDDERARASAANALRDYDAKVFPEILPALIDALSSDKSAAVRSEAADSIGKIRPITAQAGYALEQAKENDKNILVRTSARLALLQYHLLGFIPGNKAEIAFQTKEPPLAPVTDAKSVPGTLVLRPTQQPVPVTGPVDPPHVGKPLLPSDAVGPLVVAPKSGPETVEPPVADPAKRGPALVSQPKAPAPVITIPTVPVRETIVPVPTVPKPQPSAVLSVPKDLPLDLGKPAEKPLPKSTDDGPTLGPPPK